MLEERERVPKEMVYRKGPQGEEGPRGYKGDESFLEPGKLVAINEWYILTGLGLLLTLFMYQRGVEEFYKWEDNVIFSGIQGSKIRRELKFEARDEDLDLALATHIEAEVVLNRREEAGWLADAFREKDEAAITAAESERRREKEQQAEKDTQEKKEKKVKKEKKERKEKKKKKEKEDTQEMVRGISRKDDTKSKR